MFEVVESVFETPSEWWPVLVAVNRRWTFLPALGALGTGIMQAGWAGKFFVENKYFEGNRILIPLAILFTFVALFLCSAGWAMRRNSTLTATT